MKELAELEQADRFWLNGKDKMLMIPQDWKVAGDWVRNESYDACLKQLKITRKALENAIADGVQQKAEMDSLENYLEVAETEQP